jgi:hypothetical protein
MYTHTGTFDEREFNAGNCVQVSLSSGVVVAATVQAIVYRKGYVGLQVKLDNNETVLVELWQVRRE